MSRAEALSDEVVLAAQAGDAEAVAKVCARMRVHIQAFADRRADGSTLDARDLAQDGYVAVLECLAKFEVGGSAKFETYANWYLRGAIVNSTSKNYVGASIPHATLGRYWAVEALLDEGHELTEALDGTMSLLTYIDVKNVVENTGSIDNAGEITPDDGGNPDDETVGGLQLEAVDHTDYHAVNHTWALDLIEKLRSEKQKTVVLARYGFLTGVPIGVAEIAEMMGKSEIGVYKLLERGIMALKKIEGIEVSDVG